MANWITEHETKVIQSKDDLADILTAGVEPHGDNVFVNLIFKRDGTTMPPLLSWERVVYLPEWINGPYEVDFKPYFPPGSAHEFTKDVVIGAYTNYMEDTIIKAPQKLKCLIPEEERFGKGRDNLKSRLLHELISENYSKLNNTELFIMLDVTHGELPKIEISFTDVDLLLLQGRRGLYRRLFSEEEIKEEDKGVLHHIEIKPKIDKKQQRDEWKRSMKITNKQMSNAEYLAHKYSRIIRQVNPVVFYYEVGRGNIPMIADFEMRRPVYPEEINHGY